MVIAKEKNNMDKNGTKDNKIHSGLEACPSCKSDSWKSAKMVVMEGTTTTEGSLGGAVTNPGAFSGGVRDFLLSDRWFSWDYPIDAQIEFITITGLVEEIKKLMTNNRPQIRKPTIKKPTQPDEPKKIGFFARIRPVYNAYGFSDR
jgi:hypothetical protein